MVSNSRLSGFMRLGAYMNKGRKNGNQSAAPTRPPATTLLEKYYTKDVNNVTQSNGDGLTASRSFKSCTFAEGILRP